MNLFDRNRDELSKYFYDLSKAVMISYVALPILQGLLRIKLALAGFCVGVILIGMGMLLGRKVE